MTIPATIPVTRQPEVGDRAPEFAATDDAGRPVTLPGEGGGWTVLFFFPRAAATHCQMQARRFQALFPEFRAAGARLVGVSSDTRQGQVEFRGLCQLSFPLIPDRDHRLSELYGVLDDPEPGEDLRRARRETFLISPAGEVAAHWRAVVPHVHAAEVLGELWALQAPAGG